MALDLAKSVALLLALSLTYSFTIRSMRRHPFLSQAATGLLFGVIGIVGVLNPVALAPGVPVDASAVVLAMVTAVTGLWTGGLAVALLILLKFGMDGLQASSSVAVLLAGLLAGWGYHQGVYKARREHVKATLLFFSAFATLVLGCGLLLLPSIGAGPAAADLAVMLLVYTFAGWVLGRILVDARERLHSEEALRAHEARLRATVSAIPDLLCLLDHEGRLVEVLSQTELDPSMPLSALLGRRLHDLLPGPEADRVLAQVHATLKSRETLSFEADFPTRDGLRRLEGRIHALAEDEGKGNLVVLLARDVTSRHAAAQALLASELRFRSLLQNIGAVAVQGFRPDGTITYWNHASETLYGYPEAEALDRDLLELLLAPQAQPEYRDALAQMRESGQAMEAREMLLVHRNGHEIPVLSGHAAVTGTAGAQEFFRFDIDLSERKRTEAELRVAATAFEAQEGMMVTDAQRRILRVNQAFTRISGYEDVEVIGQTPTMFSSGWHDNNFYAEMNGALANTGTWEGEMWNRRKNGEIHPQWLHVTAVTDDTGAVSHFVATVTDITQRKAAEDQIRQLAFYDPLTGLPNRRMLIDRLRHALASSARSAHCGALLFIDLDHFKNLNDTLGHDKGDLLLQQVAQRLLDTVREEDTVARLGGDEYVVMLEGLDESSEIAASQATTVGEKIITKLNWPYQLAGHEFHSTPSIGLTLFNGHEVEVEELLKHADLAMYQAKGAGRNGMRFYDPQMQAAVTKRAELEADIRQGILYGQFLLYFQPQVDGAGRVVGAEALLRWKHPSRGMVSPVEFIPVAEDSGQILTLGSWILETACAQLVEWADHPDTEALTLAVNVSTRQFRQQDFAQHILDMLDYTGANPHRLKLELTESLLADNLDDVIQKMSALRARGVAFSLDDFGTGYSSLSYLKRLPLDQLKIDQSFVRDLLTDPNDAAIVKTILALGQTLGMKVIAEGVETSAQQDFLRANGCTSYQGYLYSRPVPADEFLEFLQRSLAVSEAS